MSVVTNRVGDLTVITMDDGKVNAMNPALIQELDEGLDEAMQGRGVLLVGREKVFSAGLDLKLVEQGNLDEAREFLRLFNAFLRRLILYPRPMVAAVNGHAIGAGAILALACDLRVGVPEGRIGVTGVRLGLNFPTGALEISRLGLGALAAERAILGGELVDGNTRIEQGFLHEVVPPSKLRGRAEACLQAMTTVDLGVYERSKQRLRSSVIERIDRTEAVDDAYFMKAISSEDTRRRLAAIRDRNASSDEG